MQSARSSPEMVVLSYSESAAQDLGPFCRAGPVDLPMSAAAEVAVVAASAPAAADASGAASPSHPATATARTRAPVVRASDGQFVMHAPSCVARAGHGRARP